VAAAVSPHETGGSAGCRTIARHGGQRLAGSRLCGRAVGGSGRAIAAARAPSPWLGQQVANGPLRTATTKPRRAWPGVRHQIATRGDHAHRDR
jgi:hypothetical protein